jgi:hypothetical protein
VSPDACLRLIIGSSVAAVLGFGAFVVGIESSHGQDAQPDRTRAALPALVEQRNNAMDAAALCQGDVAILKQQLADAKAELEKLKAPPK